MPDDIPTSEERGRNRRMWLTVGELVAVAGLVLAGLNFWENHHERVTTEHERAVEEKSKPKPPPPRIPALVLRGTVEGDGARVMLEPRSDAQAVQTQRYQFPTPVLDHPREIAAGKPQIDLGWFEDGLKKALKDARRGGAPLPQGETELPVGVTTTYVEDGEMRTDQSVYRLGYVANPGLLGAIKLHLTGVSLIRRGVNGDLQPAVDAAWRDMGPKAPEKPAPAPPKPASP